MNIIFGREHAASLSNNYTVLELDTICVGESSTEITAFCVIETIPILKMPRIDEMKSLHDNLLIEYRARNWNYCIQALEHLKGFWGEDVDTFYNSIEGRINEQIENDDVEAWDWRVCKKD